MHVRRCGATAVWGVAGGQGHADVAVTCLVPHDDGHLAPSASKPSARAGTSGLLTQSLRLAAAVAEGAAPLLQLSRRGVLAPCTDPGCEVLQSGCAATVELLGDAAPLHLLRQGVHAVPAMRNQPRRRLLYHHENHGTGAKT